MKKFAILCGMLLTASSAFAYGYGSDYGFSTFLIVAMIAYIILSIVILVRWWKLTKDVKAIRQHLTHSNPKLTYLVAIGEKEQAEKAALTMLVDVLYPVYSDQYHPNKADYMNRVIHLNMPRMQKLGLNLPDYVTSGEKFIDHMNTLTGKNVAYK